MGPRRARMLHMEDPTRTVSETTVAAYTEALASERPTPGGGSATAVAATLATSLTAMVVRLSLDRPKYEQHAELLAEALAASDAARHHFLRLAEDDTVAYDGYREARALPHDSDQEQSTRAAATRAAARAAASVPLTVVQECHRQVDLIERLAGRTNAFVASDLDVAVLLLEGAARGAAANVMVNLPAIADEGFAEAVIAELDQRLRQIQSATARTRERIGRGGQRRPERG